MTRSGPQGVSSRGMSSWCTIRSPNSSGPAGNSRKSAVPGWVKRWRSFAKVNPRGRSGTTTRQRSLDPRGLQCLAYQRGKLDRGRVRCGFPVRRGRCRCWKYASVTSLGRRASSVSRNTRRSLDRGTGRIPRELAQVADLRAHQHASILQPAELTLDRHVRQVECRSDAPGVALAIVLQDQQDLRRRLDTSCGRSYLFGAICGSTGRSETGGWLD